MIDDDISAGDDNSTGDDIRARSERARLVERAFGPSGTPADRQALADFDGRVFEPRARIERGPAGGEAQAESRPRVESREEVAATRTAKPRRRILRGVLAAVGVAVVAVVAFGAGIVIAPVFFPPQVATTSAQADPSAELKAVETTLPAFEAPDFSSPQSRYDVPAVAIPSTLVRSSFRQAGLDSTGPGADVYIAKDTTNYDCVVVVHEGDLSSVCTSPKYFPASGLALTWTDHATAHTITWLLDGSMVMTDD